MTDYGHELQFGIFVTPDAGQVDAVLELSKLADVLGLDLVTFQDHPYQGRFLDTWTLLSFVAAQTSNVRVAPNVANLPLRPPVVLARSVASLDILSGGRVELGLGAGAFWDGIAALGGPRLTPGQSVDALAEAIDIIRASWNAGGGPIRHEGTHYNVVGAHPGPAPVHDVEIWLGAYKPRMLALTGAKADGWLPSMAYAGIAQLPDMNAAVDRAAEAAGRRPADIRRLLNINGSFGSDTGFLSRRPTRLGRAAQRAHVEHRDERVHPVGLVRRRHPVVRRRGRTCGPRAGHRRTRGGGPRAGGCARDHGDLGVAAPDAAPLAATPTPDDGRG